MDNDKKRLNAIKNKIEYCEKRKVHKKILKELKRKYDELNKKQNNIIESDK